MNRRTFWVSTAASAALVALRARPGLARDPANPLLAPFTGPYGGVPPFHRIKPGDFKPALLEAMDLQRAELAAIVASRATPTFENTIAALESSGRAYRRVAALLATYTAAMSDQAMREVERELAPLLAGFAGEIAHHEALFARIEAVHARRAIRKLAPDQARLLDVTYRRFVRRGAALGKPHRARLEDLDGKLAALYTTFAQHQLADEETRLVVLGGTADLAGLPDAVVAAARATAEARGHRGKWAIANTRSAVEPFLASSTRRDLREQVWRMFAGRGDGGKHDNRPVIREILALRAERAKLLGFPSHAHWVLDDTMARTPDAAMKLLMRVWPAAVARAREELADLQRIADAERAGHAIAAWDHRHYAEKVRKARYDLDHEALRPYLQLDRLREGMCWVAQRLYGLRFRRVTGVPVYHADVRVFEVTRAGKRVGLVYFDPYARAGKRAGAWMSEYRTQESFVQPVTPIVSNTTSYARGRRGAPVLLSWDDARTLFHEFGHALHGLLSNVRYPTLAGTRTLREFVEFPSQLNEYWLATPEVLSRFAIHHETRKPMPADLIAKLQRARTFDQGFATVEYLLSAIYDLEIHTAPIPKQGLDPIAFEARLRSRLRAPAAIALRHRPTHFGHVFAGDDYAAGYYGYLWAATLAADAAEAFTKAGGFYDRATARKLHDHVLSTGNAIPPDEAFRRFRGRDVDPDALMRDRGFPVASIPN